MNKDSTPEPAGQAVTRCGLIRHAETIWNRERRVQGQLDSPLTPEGEQQAERRGRTLRSLPWNRILASDTARAVATAAIINAHLNPAIETESRLRELDWGRWSSRTLARIRANVATDAVCLQLYHLHWLEVAGGRMELAALNARPLA
jgi:broad specificity phosphatase PhoE